MRSTASAQWRGDRGPHPRAHPPTAGPVAGCREKKLFLVPHNFQFLFVLGHQHFFPFIPSLSQSASILYSTVIDTCPRSSLSYTENTFTSEKHELTRALFQFRRAQHAPARFNNVAPSHVTLVR